MGLVSWASSIIANCGLYSFCLHSKHLSLQTRQMLQQFKKIAGAYIEKNVCNFCMSTVQYWKVEKRPGIGVLRGWHSMQAGKDLGCNADQTPHSKWSLSMLTMSYYKLYIHCTEKAIYEFPEMELRGLVPNSYIHVYASDLYIPRIGLPIWMQQNRQTDSRNI